MDKMKMLNDDQLENVSGGGNYASADYLPANHGEHIRASELYKNKEKYINQKFYCVNDVFNSDYFVVTLKDIELCKVVVLMSQRKYNETIFILERHGIYETAYEYNDLYTVGGTYTVSSSNFTFYAYE